MLKILKIFENFENYDACQMRVISSGKLQMRRARHFPQKIQGHLLSCLWTANLKVPQSLSQWVSDQWWGHLLGCLWTAKKTKGVWVSEWKFWKFWSARLFPQKIPPANPRVIYPCRARVISSQIFFRDSTNDARPTRARLFPSKIGPANPRVFYPSRARVKYA